MFHRNDATLPDFKVIRNRIYSVKHERFVKVQALKKSPLDGAWPEVKSLSCCNFHGVQNIDNDVWRGPNPRKQLLRA